MQAKPRPVSDYNQVLENIHRFNEGLTSDTDLESLLAFYRAWYYAPEADSVGPSKFLGYQDMTAIEYMARDDLDGRETEPVLQRWFEVLEEGTPEHQYVERKVLELTARFGKRVSKAARFSAPRGWRVSSPRRDPIHGRNESGSFRGLTTGVNGHDESVAIVEVFVRAFSTLRPSEREAVLRRIGG
jgi:hypothetical protein